LRPAQAMGCGAGISEAPPHDTLSAASPTPPEAIATTFSDTEPFDTDEATTNMPPEILEDWTRLLLDRFEVRRSAFAGRGGFAVVRRGRDIQEQRTVAVKFYAESNFAEPEAQEEILKKFRHEVKVLQKLNGSYSRGLQHTTTPKSLSASSGAFLSNEVEVFFRNMPETGQDLFVALIGFWPTWC